VNGSSWRRLGDHFRGSRRIGFDNGHVGHQPIAAAMASA
jgi:hypothetical protein